MFFSIAFGTIRSWNVSRGPKSQKNHKPPILAFKIIQGYWIRLQSRASVRLPIND